MKPLFVMVLSAAALLAADGVVLNETTGKTQAGATVTIYQVGGPAGPEPIESVKSGPNGEWKIDKPFNGRGFIQTAFDGITYNQTIRPGMPMTGLRLAVYASSKSRGETTVANHMVLLEPQGDKLSIRESYFFVNPGKTAWNDPQNGTLRFQVAGEPVGQIEVNATAPQGMPIRRAAEKGAGRNEMKVDFPIKPGETRIDLAYTLPYSSPAPYKTKLLMPAAQTMIAVPNGVELKGAGLKDKGKEPTTQASVFEVDKNDLDLTITGQGDLTPPGGGADAAKGPEIEQIQARPYSQLYLLLGLAFGILGCGFAILYRLPPSPEASAGKLAPKGGRK